MKEVGKELPVRGRSCTTTAIPHLAEKFPTYDGFAKASVEDIFTTEELSEALKYEVTTFESLFLKNNGANRPSCPWF